MSTDGERHVGSMHLKQQPLLLSGRPWSGGQEYVLEESLVGFQHTLPSHATITVQYRAGSRAAPLLAWEPGGTLPHLQLP